MSLVNKVITLSLVKNEKIRFNFSERELDAINTLEKANVPGYTVMKHATGEVELSLKIWNLLGQAQMLMLQFSVSKVIDKMRDNIKSDLSYYGGVAYI